MIMRARFFSQKNASPELGSQVPECKETKTTLEQEKKQLQVKLDQLIEKKAGDLPVSLCRMRLDALELFKKNRDEDLEFINQKMLQVREEKKQERIEADCDWGVVNVGKVAVLQQLCKLHGVHPRNVILIDDNVENVKEALRAGFSAILANQEEDYFWIAKAFIEIPGFRDSYLEDLYEELGLTLPENFSDEKFDFKDFTDAEDLKLTNNLYERKFKRFPNFSKMVFAIDWDDTIKDSQNEFLNAVGLKKFLTRVMPVGAAWHIVTARPEFDYEGCVNENRNLILEALNKFFEKEGLHPSLRPVHLEQHIHFTGGYEVDKMNFIVPEDVPKSVADDKATTAISTQPTC